MTTLTSPVVPTTRLNPTSVRPAPSVSFARLVQVETRKFLDTRAGLWLLGITVALILAIGLGGALLFRQLTDAMGHNWTNIAMFANTPIGLLLPVMAVLLVTTEWSQRTALTTFTLEPRRLRVIGAKAVVMVAIAVFATVVLMAASAGFSALGGAITGEHVSWSMSHLVYAPFSTNVVSMLMAFGFGLVLMNTPAAIVVLMGLPVVVSFLGLTGERVQQVLRWVDINTAMTPAVTGSIHGLEWAKFAVAAAIWLVVPIGLGIWRHLRTEVK